MSIKEWKVFGRRYSLTTESFTKELILGEIPELVRSLWSAQYRSEAAALSLLRNTDFPVPRLLEVKTNDDGLVYALTTVRITNARPLSEVHEDDIRDQVSKQMNEEILPKLQKFTSPLSGSVDQELQVLPLARHSRYNQERKMWTRKAGHFQLIHGDLNEHNIMVDDATNRVCAIVDWEYSGYHPAEWELPLWTYTHEQRENLPEDLLRRELSYYGV